MENLAKIASVCIYIYTQGLVATRGKVLGFKIAHGYFDIAILRSHKSQEQTPVVIFSRGEIGINRMGASHMCDAFGVARQ